MEGADQNGELLYGAAAIAGALRLTTRQVRHLIEVAELPAFKLGGKVCARRSSLHAWMLARERTGRDDDQPGQVADNDEA